METILSQTGFNDISKATEVISAMGLNRFDLEDNLTLSKVKDIANFMNDIDEPAFLATSVLKKNKGGQKNIDYLYSYVKLAKDKANAEENLRKLEKELSFYR